MAWSNDDVRQLLGLIEEQNELKREGNQLLGEVLTALDGVKQKMSSGVVNVSNSSTGFKHSSSQSMPEFEASDVDPVALAKIIGSLESAEVKVIKPAGKAKPGWLRVIVKHPDLGTLTQRVSKGCACGKQIITKEKDGTEFFTCEGVTKGGCDYRPRVDAEGLQFLSNAPPNKKA